MGGSRRGTGTGPAAPDSGPSDARPDPQLAGRIRHNRLLPAQPGEHADWPDWVSPEVRQAWQRRGVERPWRHQVEAASAAHAGRHVVLTTGTASGKSLGYLLPILAATGYGVPDPADAVDADRTEPSFGDPAHGAQATLFDEPDGPDQDDEPGGSGEPDRTEPAAEQSDRPDVPRPSGSTPGSTPVSTPGSVAGSVAGSVPGSTVQHWRRRAGTALYLAPTKALAHDQLRRCTDLGLDRWRIATVDGDTPPDERDWARDYACLVLTNPDLLHYSLLPQHTRWRGLLQSLRYVVVDEAHRYRGVFGAQVAAVLRRLRRLAAFYGAEPTFVLASATAGDAIPAATALTGLPPERFVLVAEDTSVRGSVQVELWQPDDDAEALTTDLLAREIVADRQALAFVPSRRATETIALEVRAELARHGIPGTSVEAYRGGYLASDRRRIERDLQSGRLRGVAATNALELGVDIAGVDSVVICGYPGSRAALWQQAGRAGRRGTDATVRLVANRRPLDAYLLDHPDTLFDGAQEATVLHPTNPAVLGPQLAVAAQELPLTHADRTYFGDTWEALAEGLTAAGQLRRRPGGYFWTRPERAAALVDLRSAGGDAVDIVEEDTGRVLGYVDQLAADRVVHPGAVYLHLGETYLCEHWEFGEPEAFVRAGRPGYLTQAQVRSEVRIIETRAVRDVGRGRVHVGEVEVASQVRSYLRRDAVTGRVWDSVPLDLPEHRVRTTAAWWTVDELDLGRDADAAAHAAEHVCLGVLPLFAPCDHWDVGGHSDPCHPQTGAPTVFVHDAQRGGTGFAERAFARAETWLDAAYERVRDCSCELGCPRCILTGCGSSRGVDRGGATTLLRQFSLGSSG